MPFRRYLANGSGDDHHPSTHDSAQDHSTFANNVQFQMPQFLYSGPPPLALGGGAEVLAGCMFNNPESIANSWFTNYGFTPTVNSTDDSLFASTSLSNDLTIDKHTNNTSTSWPPQTAQPPTHYPSPIPLSIPPPTPAPQPSRSPTPVNLPIYSSSGYDLLSILSRVATRPNPKIDLGPVDLSCSFVVVDVRRYDSPIVYCSSTFCRLTGYEEREILGRNCRFLQAPDGIVERGDVRRYTSPEAVGQLRKSLAADKECQVSIINFRKNGSAFLNMVTVIPVLGNEKEGVTGGEQVVYHVGFQVDLTEQPNEIMRKVREGSYMVNHGARPRVVDVPEMGAGTGGGGGKRALIIPPMVMGKKLKSMLKDPRFVASIPLTTKSTAPAPEKDKEPYDGNHLLNLLILESAPDFVHVVSLKGSFLYVAPSVRRVLGYEPEELLGKSIVDFCHAADVVPLLRELKGSSEKGGGVMTQVRTVDMLYRAREKTGRYVWVESTGRLHVEPGKGRKVVILSGRVRKMPALGWDSVGRAGGVVGRADGEFWGMLGGGGTWLVVGAGVKDVVGWGVGEVIGKAVGSFFEEKGRGDVENLVRWASGDRGGDGDGNSGKVWVEMKRRDGGYVGVEVVIYRSSMAVPMICQIKVVDSTYPLPVGVDRSGTGMATDVFEELDTKRESSWQYELQQLKFANQRLRGEIEALEAGNHEYSHSPSQPEQLSSVQSQFVPPTAMVPSQTPLNWGIPSASGQTDFMGYQPLSSSLKRSWQAAMDG